MLADPLKHAFCRQDTAPNRRVARAFVSLRSRARGDELEPGAEKIEDGRVADFLGCKGLEETEETKTMAANFLFGKCSNGLGL